MTLTLEDLIDLGEVTRLIVMIEVDPLSDKYVQVLLPRSAFKQISDIAFNCQPDSKRTKGAKTIQISNMDPVLIPDVVQTIDY